jgi:anti-sigma factor RsiW
MKNELELKLQAWLDGELSAAEAGEMQRLAATDPEAGRLLAELRSVKNAFAQGEPKIVFPETREFYWSKIQRQIRRESAPPPGPALSWSGYLRRWLAPAAGLGAVAAALLLALDQSGPRTILNQVSGASGDMNVSTFRDKNAGLNFVILQDVPKPIAHVRNDGSSFMTDIE